MPRNQDRDTTVVQSQVGPFDPQPNGTIQDMLRTGVTGELIVGQAHGQHYEAASRRRLFMACNQASVTWGTSLTATAVTFTLFNPPGNFYDLVLIQSSVTMRTCSTPGHLVYAANVDPTAAIPATVTELTIIGAGATAKAYSACTLPAVPVAVRVLTAPCTAAGATPITDIIDGGLIIPPNCAVTIQGITVVGTGLASMLWEEVARAQ